MSDTDHLVTQLNVNKQLIERRDMALRLNENADFKKLILDLFCVQDCARFAQESGDAQLEPNERADALAMAQAAGHLRRYLSIQVRFGNSAEGQMSELNQAIDEARAEEDAE